MSSSSPAPTLTGPASGTGTSSPSTSQSDTNTASLYLFTFLATILILVLLSASLVLRSWILRRRYRQRFQHALADGLFPDLDRTATSQFDTLGRFRRSARPLPPSPVLWDTWIHCPEKLDTLSTITPVAVRFTPFQFPSALSSASSPHQSTTSVPSPSSLQVRSRPSIFSQLRLPSPFSLSSRPFSPSPSQTRSPAALTTLTSSRSLPTAAPTFSDPNIYTERDGGTLAVCVLIAMPSLSAPVHRSISDAKGKSADPLDFQAHQCSGDVDPLLPSSLHRSAAHIPDPPLDVGAFPLLEFGTLELRTGDRV